MGKLNKVPTKSEKVLAKLSGGKVAKSYRPKKKQDLKKAAKESVITLKIKPEITNVGLPKVSPSIELNFVGDGVKGLLKLIAKKEDNKNTLFEDAVPIFLQVACIKIPKTPNRILRLPLVHSLIDDDAEICLIVPDLKDDVKDHEKAIEHYEELLRSKDVKNIKTILPLHQLLTEYDQYELKRRLVELYDIFLVDGKITGKVTGNLGKIFHKKRKMPTCVKLNCSNLQENIDLAMRKSLMHIHSKGDSFLIQVGHSNMDENKIVDNIVNIADSLDSQFPGGMGNVRGLYVKTPSSTSIPVYYSLKSKNEIPVPVVKSKRSKAFKAFSDDISTKYNMEITVLPTGEVRTKDKKALKRKINIKDEPITEECKKHKTNGGTDTPALEEEDSDDDFFDDEHEEDLNELKEKPKKKNKSKEKKNTVATKKPKNSNEQLKKVKVEKNIKEENQIVVKKEPQNNSEQFKKVKTEKKFNSKEKNAVFNKKQENNREPVKKEQTNNSIHVRKVKSRKNANSRKNTKDMSKDKNMKSKKRYFH